MRHPGSTSGPHIYTFKKAPVIPNNLALLEYLQQYVWSLKRVTKYYSRFDFQAHSKVPRCSLEQSG